MPSDIKFTLAATHDSFMLIPTDFNWDGILAIDCIYIDYEKMKAFNGCGVTYVSKLKRNLTFKVVEEVSLLDDGKYHDRSAKTALFRKGGIMRKVRS